jgi:ribose 5-phosphate isomerase B
MKIAIASDHRGFDAKKRLIPTLQRMGHQLVDFGCDSTISVDYPDFAMPASRAVADGACEAGILLDNSGIGMSIVANKIRGIRAAVVHDDVTARISRENNHCNIICIGTDLLSEEQIRNIVSIFLSTTFGEGRHLRRLQKIKQLEEGKL